MNIYKSVLVVEDDADIRECMQDTLTLLGYESHAAGNGQEALDLLSRIEPPSLIFLDLMMPIMNGHQFSKLKKADPRLASIPLIVVSADCEVSKKALCMGADGFITKPLDLSSIIQMTRRYCDGLTSETRPSL